MVEKIHGIHVSKKNEKTRIEKQIDKTPALGNPVHTTLRMGAEQAVKTCMNVKAEDRVFIITDKTTKRIGQVLFNEAKRVTNNVHIVTLERYGKRPFLEMPSKFEAEIKNFKPTVTFYAATGQEGEIKFRLPLLTKIIPELGVRHAHMIDITEEIMKSGMCVDYSKVFKISERIYNLVRNAKKIEVTTKAGTNLVAEFNPAFLWVNSNGRFHEQGKWGNLPAGEVFTCPAKVNGTIVVDGIFGDYLSEKYGPLKDSVTITIKDSFVTSVSCNNKTLEEELKKYLAQSENSNRVGEFAIGTNIGLIKLIGNLLQDEKFPGIHIAFGDTNRKKTNADWDAGSHIDCIPLNCTIKVDGKTIMKDGKFKTEFVA